MPAITARICGICPVSHLLASVKACDAIMAVQIPPAAKLLRELIHCAQFVQSHALSFFHLSAPDLLLGFDSDPALRNVVGLIEKHPEIARDGIALRKFGQQAIASSPASASTRPGPCPAASTSRSPSRRATRSSAAFPSPAPSCAAR